jgi:RNA polymerase sigma-70 factor, ECF subfamily
MILCSQRGEVHSLSAAGAEGGCQAVKQQDKGPDSISDGELLDRYRRGELHAFETLVERYRRELFNFLFHLTHDANVAEDAFQETFLQIHRSAASFDLQRPFKPWLFTIAANKARDTLRQRQRQQAAPLDARLAGNDQGATYADLMPADIPPPDAGLANLQTRQAVDKIIAGMPENLRVVLLLCYFQEMPYQAIAEALDVPLGTVKSRLHAAVKYFAQQWAAAAKRAGNEQGSK